MPPEHSEDSEHFANPERQRRHSMHPDTLAVTAGRPPRLVDAPFNPPVVFASTYVGSADPSTTVGYGRYGNPTWTALESAIGALEGGQALTFASGMAAAYAALELLPRGGTIVLPTNCYLGVSSAVDERVEADGVIVRRVPVGDTTAVLAAAEGADLVWLESPTNPTIEVADLPAIGAALGDRTALVVDNTFATPILQRPLELGADVVLHSATKFIGGHSDALLGALVCRPGAARLERLLSIRSHRGAVPGPMEAYLVLRGLRTLAVRLERAQQNAQTLAERLTEHRSVRRVRYPGLPEDPAHEVAARTMDGFGAMIAIELADAATADAVVDAVRLWAHATSLGGVESSLERRRRWPSELPVVPEGLLRLSVGIEHVEDLWSDMERALDRVR
jgi:cystathionine gamma-synthase